MIAAPPRTLPLAILLATLLLLAVLTGCSGASKESPISEWKTQQGEAFRAQRDGQTLNPGPAGDDPVVGLDGRVAARAMKNWRDGEKKPDESNTVRLKIGTK